MSRMLVIEDGDPPFPRVRSVLGSSGHEVVVLPSAAEGLALARDWRPDLLVFDLDVRRLAVGVGACRMVRTTAELAHTLLVAVSSALGTNTEVALFDAGADDHVPRRRITRASFHARLAAHLRRASPGPMETVLHVGPLRLDSERGDAMFDGAPLDLTPKQFAILWRLATEAGRPVARADLFEGLEHTVDASLSRALDMHVRQIRRKLGGASDLIRTHYGVGYGLRGLDEASEAVA